MNKLVVNNIYMNYHSPKSSTKALENISFTVDKGEFLSIVGPSGCGKTTLLNIISGIVKPSSGEIYIDNEKLTSFSSKMGYMFQKDQLFQWLNVWDNVFLSIKIQHKPVGKYKDKITSMLKNYGLWDFIHHYPEELSGGMRQKVALIRTLALEPEFLLLDEPFSSLDYQTRLNISDEIFRIIKKEGKTAIMVTHDISEAISMSNRVVVLSKRPAKLKKIYNIDFEKHHDSPLKSREDPKFRIYFNSIWKELNH
ncbi:ABC transporter ATP-binding protein [Clostridium luticellarii]|uniref:ABC transporter ATP-binding protein n=1 Tax=Clostridium luticellarii TaxID=1691940 RepID=UPI000D0322AE|nr:ABC transporter ATP-binding protein [Clostridium luticellarii]MCI1944479.1 ABC transporter ATP-binding protein [Clostridium luticellarii]MCI1967978.1 ABC transporter ATP-binding protein [Clostridium luticellarii]MCI1995083.1 ABC transporter ATP-binding protein [Clostridium luticellarii]MCI2039242.1 ABC transporter ATP-binding protein [Clostridium luticellarii]